MGNSSSSAAGSSNNRSSQPQSLNAGGSAERTSSISPGPGHGLGSKKRSLELPDLAFAQSPYGVATAQMRGRSNGPPDPPVKTAAIAIPVSPPSPFSHYQDANGVVPRPRATVILPSQTDLRRAQTQREPSPEPATALTDESLRRHQIRMERKDRERAAKQRRESREEEERFAQQQQQQGQRSHPRGRQQPPPPAASARQERHIKRIQEAFDNSIEPPAPKGQPSNAGTPHKRNREVVRSSIPTLLKAKEKEMPPVPEEEVQAPVQEPIVYEPVPVKIVWKGGGSEVILARAGDDEWKGRQPMFKDPADPTCWMLTIDLLPGTHHVRFLVDDIWRVADDLPAAVDDQGSLANYVAVPFPVVAPAPIAAAVAAPAPLKPLTSINVGGVGHTSMSKHLVPGHSFWSTSSSADGDDDDITSPRPPKIDISKHPHASPAAVAYIQATWTNVPPPELIEAMREEEAYLQASAGQFDGSSTRVTGFVPAPNIPPAPGLPRYLDKLILNSKVGEQRPVAPSSVSADGSSPRRSGRDADTSRGLGGVGSGQGGGKRREKEKESKREREERHEREHREREREHRERERERKEHERELEERILRARRGNVPPAPPPSEIGDEEEDYSDQQNPYSQANILKNYAQQPLAASAGTSSSGGTLNNGSIAGTAVSGAPTAASGSTTPQNNSGNATPTGHQSPHLTPPTLAPVWGYVNPRVAAMATPVHLPPPSLPERAPITGSRAITLDDSNLPSLTDDSSVLPVPSHVVLHHLCTSAIKNGVLAVAHTTRYKKKMVHDRVVVNNDGEVEVDAASEMAVELGSIE